MPRVRPRCAMAVFHREPPVPQPRVARQDVADAGSIHPLWRRSHQFNVEHHVLRKYLSDVSNASVAAHADRIGEAGVHRCDRRDLDQRFAGFPRDEFRGVDCRSAAEAHHHVRVRFSTNETLEVRDVHRRHVDDPSGGSHSRCHGGPRRVVHADRVSADAGKYFCDRTFLYADRFRHHPRTSCAFARIFARASTRHAASAREPIST